MMTTRRTDTWIIENNCFKTLNCLFVCFIEFSIVKGEQEYPLDI